MAAQVVRRRACLNLPDEGMQALDELGRHDVLPGNEDVVQPTPGQQGDVVGQSHSSICAMNSCREATLGM